jgi:hypothetical protein
MYVRAWLARGAAARVSVKFRKFLLHRARGAPRGFDNLPSLSGLNV